jgi:hypothetical protein
MATVPTQPTCATPAQPAGTPPDAAHRTGDGTRPTRRQGRGSTSGAGAAMADRILASAIDEVGRGQRLGQHGEVVDSIEASRGGVAHRRGLSVAAAARRRSARELGRRSGGWRRWSS